MSLQWPTIPEDRRLRRLLPPTGTVKLVLDTDTFNEIDDQFALVYALLSKDRLHLQAVYAAPFHHGQVSGPKEGMEKSYEEIIRIFDRMGVRSEGVVLRGSERFLPGDGQPVDSAAARDLIARAMAASELEPLYVVAIGAITNVASALLLEPRIADKIVVVWLGGNALDWRTAHEFNLKQDVPAVRAVLDCGVPLLLIPCMGVASHLITTLPEIERYVKGRGAIGDFLADRYEACSADHFGYSRVIWDLSAIAWLVNPDFVPTSLAHSPVLTDQLTWSRDSTRHFIRYATYVRRNPIFRDFFQKLEQYAGQV
ncbi:nucleoside hydrolase [Paenibacillus koleovorans]|uniref:nucleoside hydrolase n=1 Tax=Paenibacillus koleovorans TaxID=121608 RepID=UPI000FDA14E5|nr:nucleoside hydrolase [Paenibacillus koleovorans]